MIKYEVYIIGANEDKKPRFEFESYYVFKESERLFIEEEGETYVLSISKVTHNLVTGQHVVRLNCHSKKYELK